MKRSSDIKREVQEFYDQFGWQEIGEGIYQNIRYEDVRPVSQEYVHRCRVRVNEHIPDGGRLILDAGSGPIQYPEYEEYSKDFEYRVCMDISIQALREARERIGSHGLYVVGDMANLPFREDSFRAVVSMHVLYHLPLDEQERAFREFFRTLEPHGSAVVVYSWGQFSKLMRLFNLPIKIATWGIKRYIRFRENIGRREFNIQGESIDQEKLEMLSQPGLETYKHNYSWLFERAGDLPEFEVRVWRSVNSAFLRALIHRPLLGRHWLRLLYYLEERFPHFFGRVGQHPMVLFKKLPGIAEV